MKSTVVIERAGHTKRRRTIMIRSLLLLVVCLPATLAGCTRTVSEAQLTKQHWLAMGEKFGHVQYVGSTSEFDYFDVFRATGTRHYKVRLPNNLIPPPNERFPYGEERSKPWAIIGDRAWLLETQAQDFEALDGDVIHRAPGHAPPN